MLLPNPNLLVPRTAAAFIALLGLSAGAWLALRSGPVLSGPEAFRWVTYANTALAASTILYTVYLWLRDEPVGRAASTLAACGAVGIVLVLLASLIARPAAGIGLYEGTALFAAGTVLAYLAMERAYATRAAGIVVMPTVMVAVFCEMWLIQQGLASTGALGNGFSGYWIEGQRLAVCLGYCPLVVAATLASLGMRRGQPATRRTVLAATWLGAPLLLLGAAMGVIGAITGPASASVVATHLACLALIVPVALGVYMRARGPEDPRLGSNAIAAFLVTTAGLLVTASTAVLPN